MLQRKSQETLHKQQNFMSHYIQQNPQHFYSATYQYQPSSNQHFSQHSQSKSILIRESSMNRNNTISGSIVFNQASIQENIGRKMKRQSSVRNGVEFKENDPLANSSLFNNSNVNRVGIINLRDSMEFVSQYDSKGSYRNPNIVKRDKNNHQVSRQKVVTQKSNVINEKNSEYLGNHDKQFEVLSERLGKLETMVKESCGMVGVCDRRVNRLEEVVYGLQNRGDIQEENKQKHSDAHQSVSSKTLGTKHTHHHSRNSRSILSLNGSSPSIKQLSQIMSLIQQSKKYQIKNSQQYRKMIEQFRMTLLEFRGELNVTVKRDDLQVQISKLKDSINLRINNSNNNVKNSNCTMSLSPKSSLTQLCSTVNSSPSSSTSQCQSQTTLQIQTEILALKLAIQKLQENAISLKADMVKYNVREKKLSEEVNLGLSDVVKRLNCLQKEWVPFDGIKRGGKCEGNVVCFKVSQEVTVMPVIHKSPLLSRSTHMQSQSFDQQQLQTPLTTSQQCQKPLSRSSSLSSLTTDLKTYYIDSSGYLLDKDSFYLLNDKNEQIRLSQKEILMLKKLKVLQ